MTENMNRLTKTETALFLHFLRKSPDQIQSWIKHAPLDEVQEMERISAKALIGKLLFGDEYFDDATNEALYQIRADRELQEMGLQEFEDDFNQALAEIPEMEVLDTSEAESYLKKFTLKA